MRPQAMDSETMYKIGPIRAKKLKFSFIPSMMNLARLGV